MTRWVNRLLPYDFQVVHTAGRTLGMADYLSRHPAHCSGSIIKSEEMFKDWFTINIVEEFTNRLERAVMVKKNEQTKSQETCLDKAGDTSSSITKHMFCFSSSFFHHRFPERQRKVYSELLDY